MKIKKLTVEEVNMLMDIVQERLDKLYGEIYDIHDNGEIVPEYLVKESNRYADIWNKLLKVRCKKQHKKLFLKKEQDLPF